MTDLKTLLRTGDPLRTPREDEGLSSVQAAAMRRQVLNAARRPDVARTPWQQPLAVAAMLALTIAAGVLGGQRLMVPKTAAIDSAVVAPPEGRRQFQFVTPGGTRIIWVFDPEFQVKETLP
jgi:hypothetical protein